MSDQMSTDPHAELYRVLLASAEECPLPALAQQVELMATVLARRIHDEHEFYLLAP